jgi:hypothetical protein
MKSILYVVHWLAGLCAVAGVFASLKGLYGMFPVWTGDLTYVPFIGELMYPSQADSGLGLMFSIFEVGFGGLAYAFLWSTPAGIALVALTYASAMIAPRNQKRCRETQS